MGKVTGLSDNFYIGGYDVSGDTQALQKISGSVNPLDVTDITQSAHSRLGGLRDGGIDFTVFHDPSALAEHAALSGLPTSDVIASYFRGTAIGNPCASCNGLQVNYDPSRAADGMLTFAVSVQADHYGLEWGLQLTAGKRTDTAATNGTSNNDGASSAFGAQAYLQVFSFAGTDATVTIQDSADNASFANVTSFSFAQVTTAPQAQRIAIANNATLRQYVRAVTTTSGGFTSLVFAVQYTRNPVAGEVF